jgi:hypothetical protein
MPTQSDSYHTSHVHEPNNHVQVTFCTASLFDYTDWRARAGAPQHHTQQHMLGSLLGHFVESLYLVMHLYALGWIMNKSSGTAYGPYHASVLIPCVPHTRGG